MLTYQDFLKEPDRTAFLSRLIGEHTSSELVRTAEVADLYDRRKNKTINEFTRQLYTLNGQRVPDYTASNNRIASNLFHRLNTQRATYSLGNGVTFQGDGVKERLGIDFDTNLYFAGRLALIHGVSFIFFNLDHVHVFPVTEFAPLWDEETGALRAGLRFWRLEAGKPLQAVFYEEDGYTVYSTDSGNQLHESEPKRGYKETLRKAPVDAEPEVVGVENYNALPVVPLWGSRLHQSTLVGMREAIDSFDLIRSGFADDLTDCAQIYWLLENYGGMTNEDLARFRDRLKFQHIAVADTTEGQITPYTQEIPYNARQAYLEMIRSGIYEDFGALDVTTFSAGQKTATEIQAAYQPMDEEADDFEYQVILAVQKILALLGIEDTPIFKRNRITNQLEQVQLVMMEAEYLDDETLLSKLPNITPDEIETIIKNKDAEGAERMSIGGEDDEGI